jgi:hypothetical protein
MTVADINRDRIARAQDLVPSPIFEFFSLSSVVK